MKKKLFTLAIILFTATASMAQEHNQPKNKRPFSPEEFQAKQKAFITEKAALTPEEAEAFFPLFFELQKRKFKIDDTDITDSVDGIVCVNISL